MGLRQNPPMALARKSAPQFTPFFRVPFCAVTVWALPTNVVDVAVAARARSGARMAFVTVADPVNAARAASVMWTWWVDVPQCIDARGWRYVPVQWLREP